MGVYHFMGVGKSVGAVTCAVDYIEKALDLAPRNQEIQRFFMRSGGIRHEEHDQGKIEALVLFTSKEVINKTLLAFSYLGCERPGPVREEIVRHLKKVWKRADPDVGRKVFWCEVDVDDYQDCFDKMIRVAYRFSPPGKQGKEIWCNLTGGANAIQLALLSMARLTAISTTHYLISQRKAYQQAVEVPSEIRIHPNRDSYFNIVPFFKFSLDTFGFYDILTELETLNKSVTTSELLNRLKGKQLFLDSTEEEFARQYMLKLYGLGYTTYSGKQTDLNEISELGMKFLVDELLELERKLSQREANETKSGEWKWFTEEKIG
jgi:hypothetical protein